MGFPGSSASKESACNAGDPGSITGLGRSPGEGMGFPGGSDSKECTCSVRDLGSIPGLGRYPWRRACNPFQYSCLENQHGQSSVVATVHGVAKSRT